MSARKQIFKELKIRVKQKGDLNRQFQRPTDSSVRRLFGQRVRLMRFVDLQFFFPVRAAPHAV
jgi:hypothetical protein